MAIENEEQELKEGGVSGAFFCEMFCLGLLFLLHGI
jgi:hypothetical protein